MAKLRPLGGWAQVPNEVLSDTNLSMKAKGLFAYMQSKPEGWDFSCLRIAKETTDGVDSICAGLKELEENGYMTRCKSHDAGGKWEWEHILTIPPVRENPVTVKPVLEKPVIKKEVSNKTITTGKAADAASDFPVKVERERVPATRTSLEKKNEPPQVLSPSKLMELVTTYANNEKNELCSFVGSFYLKKYNTFGAPSGFTALRWHSQCYMRNTRDAKALLSEMRGVPNLEGKIQEAFERAIAVAKEEAEIITIRKFLGKK